MAVKAAPACHCSVQLSTSFANETLWNTNQKQSTLEIL